MRNYIVLNGTNSNTISGLLIQELAPISKPLIRTQIEEIDGRDGDIVTPLGFSAYDKEITIGLYGDFDINQVVAFFNSEGTVIFSNEPDKYYNYEIIDQIDFERLVRYRTAKVTMHCQPFKYSATQGAEVISPSSNLISIPNFSKTTNGITVAANDGIITVQGTGSATTEFYVPTGGLALQAGSYTFTATASGRGATAASLRLIKSAPSNADSFGGKYITLKNAPVSISSSISAATTYNYLWFYINGGTELNFTLTVDMENDAANVATGEGSAIMLDGTGEAPFNRLDLKSNAIQDGTPTPSAPVGVQTVTGGQTVKITGKNLFGGLTLERANYCTYTLENNILTITPTDTTHNTAVYFYLGSPLPAGDYIFNSQTAIATSVQLRNASIQTVANLGNSYQNKTFTLTETAPLITLNWYTTGSTNPFTVDLSTLQIEVGSTATTYEPYHEQSYEINLGKNLACVERSGTWQGMAFTSNGDGSFSMSGTSTAVSAFPLANAENYVYMKAGTYFLSANNPVANSDVTIRLRDSGGATSSNWSLALSTTNATRSITLSADKILCVEVRVPSGVTLSNFVIKPQLEAGSVGTSYAQYFKPIELCKIGNYQDYIYNDDGTWKIHKEINEVALDGSNDETWAVQNSGTANYFYVFSSIPQYAAAASSLSNYFARVNISGSDTNVGFTPINSTTIRFRPNFAEISLADWKTWLASHTTVVYHSLATSTDTAITNEGLIEQLEAIDSAHSYRGRTHITALAAAVNAPHIIAAEVVKNSDGTITNSGNIYSKPKLTIYGSGDISVYLNDLQVFQIALGDEEYITIDTNAMEAYKDTIDNLKNRLVTGDYNNFALQVGENQITFSGAVTKCIVENYSRWL